MGWRHLWFSSLYEHDVHFEEPGRPFAYEVHIFGVVELDKVRIIWVVDELPLIFGFLDVLHPFLQAGHSDCGL